MSTTPQPVLVTGAFGNVGRHTLRALLADGRRVVATDRRSPAAERAAREFAGRLEVRWADVTDAEAVRRLVAEVSPSALVHLAAVIPPATYADPNLARRVNVDATALLVAAAEALPHPCRFAFASSVAVYGSRNPYTMGEVDADTPTRPREQYGAHKVASETIIRASSLDWVVLRLGAVMFHDMDLAMDLESMVLEALLPSDGRLHAVDGRDVAGAFAAALEAPCVGRVLLIGGDPSHRMTQREFAERITAAAGLPGAIPPGRPGDPQDDEGWFNVDWMDTSEAQRLLDFQQHPWPETINDFSQHVGPKRRILPLAAPAARLLMTLRSPYRGTPAGPARVWEGIARRWGADSLTTPVA